MLLRPRDVCSAAFYDDVKRLHKLATAGIPRSGLDHLSADEEDLDSDVERELDSSPEWRAKADRYGDVAAVSEGEAEAGGDAAAAAGVSSSEENEGSEADVDAQRSALAQLRALFRRRLYEAKVAARVNRPGLLLAGRTVVDARTYGFLFGAAEVPRGDGHAQSGARALHVTWKASKRAPLPACPLHWAVLGRAHAAVEYLVANGADISAAVPFSLPAGSAGPTAEAIAQANQSAATRRVLLEAAARRQAALREREDQLERCEAALEELRVRQEARHLAQAEERALNAERRLHMAEEDDDVEETDVDEGDI